MQQTAPTGSEAERAKFAARRDRALVTVVLSVDTSLLYLVGNHEDPVVVWKKLADQLEKKTWATRLDLRRKLHSLRLKDGQETAPTGSEAERAKFAVRRDRALATVVLSVDTSLLYLVGNPEYSVVWKKLADQFEKNTWVTRLDLRRKLHSLRLKDG